MSFSLASSTDYRGEWSLLLREYQRKGDPTPHRPRTRKSFSETWNRVGGRANSPGDIRTYRRDSLISRQRRERARFSSRSSDSARRQPASHSRATSSLGIVRSPKQEQRAIWPSLSAEGCTTTFVQDQTERAAAWPKMPDCVSKSIHSNSRSYVPSLPTSGRRLSQRLPGGTADLTARRSTASPSFDKIVTPSSRAPSRSDGKTAA